MNGRAVSPVVPRLVPRLLPRLLNVRQRMRAAAVDALVVSHLPNIRYLTGFVGTAGLVVLTPTACALIVDFRYQTVARALLSANPEAAAHFNVVVPAQSYDETLADVLRECGARRIGIEAAHMPVSRFNRLAAALAGSAPTPLRSADACPALVPTERIIESERVVKDEDEIRTCGRRGGASRWPRPKRPRSRVSGARSSKSPPTSTRYCAGTGSSDRRSRRLWPRDRIARCRMRGRATVGFATGMESCWTLAGSTTDTAWILRAR